MRSLCIFALKPSGFNLCTLVDWVVEMGMSREKSMKYFGFGMVAIVAALVMVFLLSDRPGLILDSKARAELQHDGLAGSFIQLSDGMTHYRSVGSDDSPVILLIHGFSLSSLMYESYYKPLTAAGFRVIAIDLYGRGFSDRLNVPNDSDLLVRQIREFMEAIDAPLPYHIVGSSMGGALVVDLAARYPDDIQSLALLTPVGLSAGSGPPAILKMPIIGNWITRVFGPKLIRERFYPYIAEAPNSERMRRLFEAQIQYQGYYTSILSASRHFSFAPRETEHKKIAARGIRTLSIWGDADGTVSIEGKDVLRNWNPNARIFVLENGDHDITFTRPDEILELLKNWFDG
jgi:pimeloyl-ACP methyl ester carboxylesterase